MSVRKKVLKSIANNPLLLFNQVLHIWKKQKTK